MPIESPMKHICGRFWFASRAEFVYPGIYYWNGKANIRILSLPKLPEPPQLVEFPEQTVVIAKDQPQYRQLPAYRFSNDPEGKIVCCWQLGWRDRLKVLFTGKLWHQVMTFNGPLQPQLLLTDKPRMPLEPSKPWPRK